ncbi:hypothetical protein BST61_g1281 [Cercospora zeina]
MAETTSNSEHHGAKIDNSTARGFHQDSQSPYLLPNDAAEHARLERQSRLLSAIMSHKIPHAPLDPTKTQQRLLDIGCGTGYVTKTLADAFPNAQVYGLDLSPVPQIRDFPPNVRFLQGNIVTQSPTDWKPLDDGEQRQARLTSHENLFDLCFERLCANTIPDPASLVKREFQLLKPGGWIEMHDIASPYVLQDGSTAPKFDMFDPIEEAYKETGAILRPGDVAADWMQEAGFVNVQAHEYLWPIDIAGASPEVRAELSDIADGTLARDVLDVVMNLITGVESRGLVDRETASYVAQWAREFHLSGEQKYFKFIVTIGQKPE